MILKTALHYFLCNAPLSPLTHLECPSEIATALTTHGLFRSTCGRTRAQAHNGPSERALRACARARAQARTCAARGNKTRAGVEPEEPGTRPLRWRNWRGYPTVPVHTIPRGGCLTPCLSSLPCPVGCPRPARGTRVPGGYLGPVSRRTRGVRKRLGEGAWAGLRGEDCCSRGMARVG